jgi:release factor glutamine methyltransferase
VAQPLELSSLHELVDRAGRHEPVQYLVGHAWFFGRPFTVTRSVFIPRPCTETLVDHVVQWHRAAPGHTGALLADVGTGCGSIAISMAASITGARVVATDISTDALETTRVNAERHGVTDRLELRQGPALEPLRTDLGGARFDVIASNPPYISDGEWKDVPANVRDHEPAAALRAGSDGLDTLRPLISGAGRLLRPGGQLVVEIAHSQRDAVLALAEEAPALVHPVVLKDHEGLWRVLVAEGCD